MQTMKVWAARCACVCGALLLAVGVLAGTATVYTQFQLSSKDPGGASAYLRADGTISSYEADEQERMNRSRTVMVVAFVAGAALVFAGRRGARTAAAPAPDGR